MQQNGLLIKPDWPLPAHIHACSTTRDGGVSLPPYDTMNLGQHVGDDPQAVGANRERLAALANLPAPPLWLEQVHGTRVIDAMDWQPGIEADAIFSHQPGQVCTVMTADCLPVLFSNRRGTQVAAAHAGWRGLLNGVLENTAACFDGPRKDILAWLGPAIGPGQFEVGAEVYDAFISRQAQARQAFKKTDASHYLANIYLLARQRLAEIGITSIYGGNHCTVTEDNAFFSYRRDSITGRMASLIWIEPK